LFYVYILQSTSHPSQTYIGSTSDLKKRVVAHNSGKSIHTNKFKPWKVEVYIALQHKELAEKFEAYLKTGSGRAFVNKRFRLAHLPVSTTE
jgi:putative endonuclease